MNRKLPVWLLFSTTMIGLIHGRDAVATLSQAVRVTVLPLTLVSCAVSEN